MARFCAKQRAHFRSVVQREDCLAETNKFEMLLWNRIKFDSVLEHIAVEKVPRNPVFLVCS